MLQAKKKKKNWFQRTRIENRDEQHFVTHRRTVMITLSGLMIICTDYWQNAGPLQKMTFFKCPVWHNMTRGNSINNSHPEGCVKRGKSVLRLKLHPSYALFQMSVIKPIFWFVVLTFLFDFSHSAPYIFILSPLQLVAEVQVQHIVKIKQDLCVTLRGMS